MRRCVEEFKGKGWDFPIIPGVNVVAPAPVLNNLVWGSGALKYEVYAFTTTTVIG